MRQFENTGSICCYYKCPPDDKKHLRSLTRSCKIPSSLLQSPLGTTGSRRPYPFQKVEVFVSLMTALKNWIKLLLLYMCTYIQKIKFIPNSSNILQAVNHTWVQPHLVEKIN